MRCLPFLVLIGLASPALGRDVYVNNLAGDDQFTGDSPISTGDLTGPVRTIRQALRRAEAGDRVVLAATEEPYREQISLIGARNSGTPGRPFILEGNGAILDGAAPVPAWGWRAVSRDEFLFRPLRKSTHNLFLDGRPAPRKVVDRLAQARPELAPGEWCLWQGGVYYRLADATLPQDLPLSHSRLTTGITLYHVEHVAIVNLIVQGFQVDGVNVNDGVRGCVLAGLTCRGNGRSGTAVVNSGQAKLTDCLIGDNGEAQFFQDGFSLAEVEACELLENTAPALVRRGGRLWIDGAPAAPVP